MSIRKAVYDLLNDTESNVYPLRTTQELTDPYITYAMRRDHTRSQDGIEMKNIALTLNVYANSFSACIELADTMSAALEDQTGTYDTETLHVCNWESEDELWIEELDKYVITQEYLLKFL